jgi:hypothetical protein
MRQIIDSCFVSPSRAILEIFCTQICCPKKTTRWRENCDKNQWKLWLPLPPWAFSFLFHNPSLWCIGDLNSNMLKKWNDYFLVTYCKLLESNCLLFCVTTDVYLVCYIWHQIAWHCFWHFLALIVFFETAEAVAKPGLSLKSVSNKVESVYIYIPYIYISLLERGKKQKGLILY